MRIIAVFFLELGRIARRERTYWLRTIYVAFLATVVALNWLTSNTEAARFGAGQEAIGRQLFSSFAWVQFVLLNVAAPVFLCTAISDERNRGTLPVLLTTRLSAFEIVMGKLFGGLIPVLLLLASGVPIVFLLLVFGGLGPVEVLSSFVLTLVCAVFAASLALFFSCFTRTAYGCLAWTMGVLATYIVLPLLLLDGPLDRDISGYGFVRSLAWYEMRWFDVQVSPYLGFNWILNARDTSEMKIAALGVVCCVVLAVVVLLLTAVPLRWAEARGGRSALMQWLRRGRRQRTGCAFAPGDGVENVVFLRETRGIHAALRGGGRYLLWGLLPVVGVIALMSDRFFPVGSTPVAAHFWMLPLLSLGALVLPLIGGAQIMAREKEGNSFDVLLATPLSGKTIVEGKLAAVLVSIAPVLLLPVVYAFFFARMGSLNKWVPLQILIVVGLSGVWLGVTALFAGLLVRKRAWAVLMAVLLVGMIDLALYPLWVVGEGAGVIMASQRGLILNWLFPVESGEITGGLVRDFILFAGIHLLLPALLLTLMSRRFDWICKRCA